jgi:two-component system LytT family sensor kinase
MNRIKGKFRISIPAVFIHVIVWLALLLIPAIVFSNVKFDTGLPDGFFLVTNLVHIGLFYLNAYYLYPGYMTRKRWWLYFLFIGLIIAGVYQIKLFFLHLNDPAFMVSDKNFHIILFPPVPFLFASFIFGFVNNRIKMERAEKERRAETLASELKFLRSQISPHFLFNVMTNLVSMARQKSDGLEPTLIRLSDMLRYMLYETKEDKFPLAKEIEYLSNYVELQKMRFGEDVEVKLDIKGDKMNCTIEPMLLIPFVENAFKHGIGLVEEPFIHISIGVVDAVLVFRVANNYNKNNLSKDKNSGIGLLNVRNRLNLLYGEKHKLSVIDNGELYSVVLKLELLC